MIQLYQALYRKYRPKTFDEVVGQEVIIQTLKNAIKNNKTSHAYLFTGPRGTGKTSIAKIFAKTINCLDPIDGNSCGICVSCAQIDNKQTTDIIEIDAASNNGVDEIRELKSKVGLVPANSRYKVYIIDEVHMLTVGAFNALLKTLEEPPSHIIFILATTEPHKIPSTILSRCQRFDFKKINDYKIVEYLKKITQNEKIEIDSEALMEIARLSDGGMRDSISTLDQVIAYAENKITMKDVHTINGTPTQQELKKLMLSLLKNDILTSFHILDEYYDSGKNMIKLTEEMILFLRNTLLLKIVPNYFEQNEKCEIYQEIATIISKNKILDYIKEFNTSLSDMKNSNNPKMLLELSIVKLMGTVESKEKLELSNPTNDEQIRITESDIIENATVSEPSVEKKISPPLPSSEKTSVDEKKEKIIVKTFQLSSEQMNALNLLKETRINNTLAQFDRKIFTDLKSQIDEVRSLLLNPDYSDYVAMVLDGSLKAASNSNLIFVFQNDSDVQIFNENILNIEPILELTLEKKYKVIATSNETWEQIKHTFNSKQKEYIYQEEDVNFDNIFKPEIEHDDMKKLFGDIVEYQ